MCATRGALVVATSVGLVETLKDQGYCKLNNNIVRSMAQHVENQMRSLSQTNMCPNSSTISKKLSDENKKKAEESLRTVMFLSIWGPNC